jgi:protein-L-isoaspartate O-methyltransferase
VLSKLSGQRILVRGSALRQHERRAPSSQTVVDIFDGEWVSRLPPELSVQAGKSQTFDDPRLHWAIPRLKVEGSSVLELGALEGGHSFMLERAGARSVTAVESNRRAFLRCLATRQLLGMERVEYLCGDFLAYLRTSEDVYDACVACGVLYHLLDPVELIALLSHCARRLFLWTHFYDREILSASRRFAAPRRATTGGFTHDLHSRRYSRVGLRLASFPGGSNPSAAWLTKPDLLGALEHFGWIDVELGLETFEPEPGPALALVATNGRLAD